MISTDMIERVQNRESGITNEESIVASHARSMLKYIYYRVFAVVYGVVGHFCSDITMVNSTWTHDHIQKLWGKPPLIVYPGCGSIQEYMKFDLRHRDQMVLSLSQFRPEKNHLLQLQSLKILLIDHAKEMASKFPEFKLVIIGSCPTKESENLVMTLRKEAEKLDISDHVEFVVNASFADMKPYLERSSIGIHTMSNEHFGISNVEIMAAGIIHIANDSAGPKFDIIKPGTGFLATTARTYAKTIWQVLNMTPTQLFQMRQAARESTWRFSDDEFNRKFLAVISTTLPFLYPFSICTHFISSSKIQHIIRQNNDMATLEDVALLGLVQAEFSLPVASLETPECLPEEVEEGNVEYKQQLLEPTRDRLRQLTTQMHWRLNEGGGTAFYELGVKDNGEVLGLTEDAMLSSLGTLARMCRVVHAEMKLSKFRAGRDARHKAVRIKVTRVLEHNATKRLRVSVIGDFESGKSTLVGVLTRGCLDDGNGLARMQVCRHRHELENGCTSSVSEHTIAVAVDGHFRSTDELPTCDFGDSDEDEEKQTTRRQESFITLSDLAGHKKYLKSTASGLAGQFPDYAMLVVDAVRGVRDMTREHIKIATALDVAIFVVITKTDRATDERIQQVLVEVADLLKAFCPYQRVVLTPKNTDTFMCEKETLTSASIVPVFQISSVDGSGLDVLQGYLAALEPKRVWAAKAETPAEFQISQAYDIEDTGIIVTGLVQAGTFCVGEQMLLGPDSDGHFCDVAVESIEVQLQPAYRIRKGTMLVHPSIRPTATRQFDAELQFLPDARAFRENFQAVIHTGQTLKIRDLDSFYDPDVTTAVQRMRHEAYSLRRHEEMQALRVEKQKLVDAADRGVNTMPSRLVGIAGSKRATKSSTRPKTDTDGPSSMSSGVTSTPGKKSSSALLQIERQRLEKVRQRQERELGQMLEFEMKMNRLQQEATEKMEREKRQHEAMERSRMRFAQELAAEKRAREIKKKAQLDAEEERRKELAAQLAARDRALAEEKSRQEKLRRIEAREREEERKIKAEEHRAQTEALLHAQQMEIQARLRELDLAEKAREEMVEQQRAERAIAMDARRREVTLRIRKNLRASKKLEAQRKREIQRKQLASEALREAHEQEERRSRELQAQQQLAIEKKRQLVLAEARRDEARKKEELLERQREIERNVQQVQKNQEHERALRSEYKKLQTQLKLDKVERMKRVQEYQRLEMQRKMQDTEARTQHMLNEKESLVNRRKQLAIKTKIQRDMIMRTMENVKITKKWHQASKTIEK
ncbi:GTP-binding protein, partial [Phytophthora palmivora]